MMDEQLDDVASRGEPLAALTASESSIYGRFGYGQATSSTWWQLTPEGTAFASPSAAVRHRASRRPRHRAARPCPRSTTRAARARVGEVDPQREVLGARLQGAAPARVPDGRRHAVLHRGARRTRRHARRVRALLGEERVAARPRRQRAARASSCTPPTAEAEAALWEYLLGIDLVAHGARPTTGPVDEPLRWRLADPRRLQVRAAHRPPLGARRRRGRGAVGAHLRRRRRARARARRPVPPDQRRRVAGGRRARRRHVRAHRPRPRPRAVGAPTSARSTSAASPRVDARARGPRRGAHAAARSHAPTASSPPTPPPGAPPTSDPPRSHATGVRSTATIGVL